MTNDYMRAIISTTNNKERMVILMWNKELSVLLSKGLIVLGLIMAVCLSFTLPQCVGWLEDYYYRPLGHIPTCIIAYLVMGGLVVLLIFLFRLLNNISRRQVFEKSNTTCLRLISWCCFFVSALLFAWGLLTFLEVIFLAGFVTGFMGLILRVLKNVFEEAVSIREENDYTI
ncbi:MAG: DUF2975 domain-containing protein [Ruminococcus sp.]|nr:DUF2975 domain-containing protein [Ruminococcus sp.]